MYKKHICVDKMLVLESEGVLLCDSAVVLFIFQLSHLKKICLTVLLCLYYRQDVKVNSR